MALGSLLDVASGVHLLGFSLDLVGFGLLSFGFRLDFGLDFALSLLFIKSLVILESHRLS